MLERATACLKSEAVRDSLRCAQRISKSKRRLHSTFWSHGAGDLDLPPWALPTFSRPSDLPLKSNDRPQRGQRSEKRLQTEFLRDSVAVSESPFLDFLYPPQALAWLQRANAQHWQRWERRNARRLPEGFIVASRSYASRSQVQNLSAGAISSQVKERQKHDMSSEMVGQHRGPQDINSKNYQTPESDARKEESPDDRPLELLSNGAAKKDSSSAYNPNWQVTLKPGPIFADSPGDLDALNSASSNLANADGLGGLQGLLQIMASNKSRRSRDGDGDAVTLTAIEIYKSLGDEARSDVRLKREFLQWLCSRNDEPAQACCFELHEQIPIKDRTLQTYQSIIDVSLTMTRPPPPIKASELHKEALQNLENGHQISRTLFRHAVKNHKWPLAIEVEKAHHERYSSADVKAIDTNQSRQVRIFWLYVSEIPNLLFKAVNFSMFLEAGNVHLLEDDHTSRFVAAFSKEAISQGFLRTDGVNTLAAARPIAERYRGHIRRILARIAFVEDAPKLFHDVLLQMLRTDSELKYSALHPVVSFVYTTYSKMVGFQPTEELFMLWLQRLTRYADGAAQVTPSSNSFTISLLVRQWLRHFGKINKDGVLWLMQSYARTGQLELFEKWLKYFRSEYPAYEDQRDGFWMSIWVHAKRADLDAAQRAFAEVKRATAEHGDEPDVRCWDVLLLAHSRVDDAEGAFINLQNMINSNTKPHSISFQNVLLLLAKRGDVAGATDLLEQYDRVVGEKRTTYQLRSLLIAHIQNDDVETAVRILRAACPGIRSRDIVGPATHCFNVILMAYAFRKDIKALKATYRWMRQERFAPDSGSYEAVMQAVTNYRRTQQAYGTLKRTLPAQRIEPTALHYEVLIDGFCYNRQYPNAVEAYHRMLRENVKPSNATHASYLIAKAILGYRRRMGYRLTERPNKIKVKPIAEEEVMTEFESLLRTTSVRTPSDTETGSSEPQVDSRRSMPRLTEVPEPFLEFLIFAHDNSIRSEAVEEMYQQYMEDTKQLGKPEERTQIHLLESVAAWAWSHERHEDVEQCWRWAKEQTDELRPLAVVPKLRVPASETKLESNRPADLEEAADDITASREVHSEERHTKVTSSDPAASEQVLLLDKQEPRPQPPSPSYRYKLSQVLHYYIRSLQAQGRMLDAISTVTQLISEGYGKHSISWNFFAQILCQHTPPLGLLAFVLAERYLSPQFPGWANTSDYIPTRETRAQGLEYIKTRYLPQLEQMLQYKTVVHLASVLTEMRKTVARGDRRASVDLPPQMNKYVGTIEQIRRHAPKTLFIVQTMPSVIDGLQTEILGDEAS